MVKTVTDAFKNLTNKNNARYYRKVEIYRREWDGVSAYAYVSALDITKSVKSIGDMSWQLDTEGVGVWRVSNLSLVDRKSTR